MRNVGEAQVLQGLDVFSDDLGEPILVHSFNEICREDVTRGLLPFLDDVCQTQTVGRQDPAVLVDQDPGDP